MKILLVSLNHSPEQTGIGKFQGEMTKWLAGREHEVRVVTAPPYYPAWKIGKGYSAWRYTREKLEGAVVYRVPLYVPATPSGTKRLIHTAVFACAATPVILWQALFWRPDVIIATAPPLSVTPTVLFAGWISGAKSHLHVQDFEVDAAFNLGILKHPLLFRIMLKIERVLLRGFDRVSSISRRMCERLAAKGVAKHRTFLVPNWAGVQDFDPARAQGSWRQRQKLDGKAALAVYSGNMGRKQGLETIVEAARLLKDKAHIHFIVCGDGSARAEITASAEGLANISFLPVQPGGDFIEMMEAADIHLLPQRAEAADLVMPSKLGNILASGKPVVAGAKADTQIYDAVQDCGIAVPPDDPAAFAKAVATLANDAAMRARMGEMGRRRALEDWSQDSILTRFEALLAA